MAMSTSPFSCLATDYLNILYHNRFFVTDIFAFIGWMCAVGVSCSVNILNKFEEYGGKWVVSEFQFAIT